MSRNKCYYSGNQLWGDVSIRDIYTTIGIHRCTFDVEIVKWLCCKYLAWHGHQRSWRLLEAKNTPSKSKMAWRSQFIEKSYSWKFLSNLKNPLTYPIRFELWPQVREIHPVTSEVTELYVAAAAATPSARSNIPICRYKTEGCYVDWFKLWHHLRKIHPSDLRSH